MRINVRNNNGRCMIRFKCPIYGKSVAFTHGNFYDEIDRANMGLLALKISNAVKLKQWTGRLQDYTDDVKKEDRKPLIELLRLKSKGNPNSIEMTLVKKLSKIKPLETPTSVERWLTGLELSPASFNRYRTVIMTVRPDLTAGIKPLKVIREEPNPFTLFEQSQIISAIDNPADKHLITFWLKCGFRNGELCALSKDDFIRDGDNYWLDINKSLVRGVLKNIPKNGKKRKVPLSKQDWNKFREPYINSPNLYESLDSSNFIRTVWKPLLGKAGVAYRKPYCMRSTAISNYLHAGNDILTTAKVFGTSSEMIDRHYGNIVNRPNAV